VPGRSLSAALLVALSALAALVVAPGAASAVTSGRLVAGSPSAATASPQTARPTGLREAREAPARRTARAGTGKETARHAVAHDTRVAGAGPSTTTAVLAAVAGLVLLVAVGGSRRPDRVLVAGRTPGRCRGRAPPAYATA
jgi:hypothetical protein